jgi:hypothetical protein
MKTHPPPSPPQLQTMMKDPIKFPTVLETKLWDRKVMYPRYVFESGLTTNLRKEVYEWWRKHYVYPESTVKNVKIRFIPKTNRTLEHFLIHKKPPRETLTRMEPSKT